MYFNFGQRKIQKTNYSFLCPLPAAWARNAKLDQSSSVNIELLDDGSIRITPAPYDRQATGAEGQIPAQNKEVLA